MYLLKPILNGFAVILLVIYMCRVGRWLLTCVINDLLRRITWNSYDIGPIYRRFVAWWRVLVSVLVVWEAKLNRLTFKKSKISISILDSVSILELSSLLSTLGALDRTLKCLVSIPIMHKSNAQTTITIKKLKNDKFRLI